jgi:hypothetical protein
MACDAQALPRIREIAMEGMGKDDGGLSPIHPHPRYDVVSVDVRFTPHPNNGHSWARMDCSLRFVGKILA